MATESKNEAVASRIRALRGTRPQPQVADEVGVTLRAYQEWEAGGGIAWPNLRKLAEVHRVSTNWLEHGDEQPERAHSQLDRIERKLDDVLARLGAVTVDDLFETPIDEIDSAQGGRRESQGRRAG
jgi:hypothetical protein